MNRYQSVIKQFIIATVTAVLAFGIPASAFAETPVSTDLNTAGQSSAAPATDSKPSGPDAATYTYNAMSGMWENAHFTWNPVTHQTLAKDVPLYTYNPQTGQWDSFIWQFDATTNNYVQTPISVVTPPTGAVTQGGPAAATAAANEAASSAMASTNSAAQSDSANPASPVSGSGNVPPSGISPAPAAINLTASPAALSNESAAFPLTIAPVTNVTLNTVVSSAAQSGNAWVQDNKHAGNATTGNAQALATVINLLQSSASLAGTGLATFTKDIQGDVSGNIFIDPSALLQPATNGGTDLQNMAIRSQLNGTIQNDIDLSAVSGNATVSGNKRAGNATTGNADAVANVLNLINSVIAANQSFLGVINIYGNLSGDILLPADSLNALLAGNEDNAQPAAATDNADAQANLASSQHITNNTDLAATTGNALVQDNKHSGNAASGNALTKLTILNFTGHQVNAANSLLVFVNVLGTWVGVIMDAPAGTTAAALTGGNAVAALTDSGSDQPTANTVPADAAVMDSMNITNNITARARSGDATVAQNRRAGNATTGNATASANIVNIMNSQFSLSHWFGVLFINVFGSWLGNFGTAKPAIASIPESSGGGTAPTGVPEVQVFRFAPGTNAPLGLTRVSRGGFGGQSQYDQLVDNVSAVLADHDISTRIKSPARVQFQARHQPRFSLSALPIVLGLTGLTVIGTERIRSIRNKLTYRIRR